MYSVNLVLELSLSFTKIGLADQFLEITLPCWKSSLRGRSRRFEKESPRSISWRKKGCCAIGRGGVKVVSAIGRGRVKGVSASELLPCRCLIKMPSIRDIIGTFSNIWFMKTNGSFAALEQSHHPMSLLDNFHNAASSIIIRSNNVFTLK